MTTETVQDAEYLIRLRERYRYDEDSGHFYRLKGGPVATRNQPAGWKDKKGYTRLNFNGRTFLAHRLAWLYVYGGFPNGEIDHINRFPSDNRISNLRVATRKQNNQNTRASGVYMLPSGNWRACISTDHKNIHLGTFLTKKEAQAAYRKAKHLTHEFSPEPYSEAVEVCAQAYQAVGVMLCDLGMFNTERGEKLLDNLSQHRLVHDDVLPWPSTPHPAIGNWPAVDEAMVMRAIKSSVMADADWHTGRVLWPHNQHREAVMNAARADLTAVLIDSAQDGKGE